MSNEQVIKLLTALRHGCRKQLESLHFIQTGVQIDLEEYKCEDTKDMIDRIYSPIIDIPEPDSNATYSEIHHILKKIKKLKLNKGYQLLGLHQQVSKNKESMNEIQLEAMTSLMQTILDQFNF